MHEKGRCSGGCEGRSDLASDVAGFAHAGHDDSALRRADDIDSGRKAAAKAVAQGSGECVNAASSASRVRNADCDRGLRAIARQVSGFRFGHGGLDSMKRASRQA
jgi:hypothetical protein